MAAHPDKLDALLGAGFANQGESFLLWDWETGEPVTPVISWQDGRCEALCQQLVDQGKDQWFHQRDRPAPVQRVARPQAPVAAGK